MFNQHTFPQGIEIDPLQAENSEIKEVKESGKKNVIDELRERY